MPRIAPRVGATRQPCRLRLTDGTHTAPHRLAPHPRHMRERPRQPTRTRCTVPGSHGHARALRASVARRHRASCTGSIERSKPVVLRVLSVARARSCQLGSGWCVLARAVARPTLAPCQTSSRGARRLACDARTPGRHSRALGHDVRARRLMCCMSLRHSSDGAGLLTLAFASALEPALRTWTATHALALSGWLWWCGSAPLAQARMRRSEHRASAAAQE